MKDVMTHKGRLAITVALMLILLSALGLAAIHTHQNAPLSRFDYTCPICLFLMGFALMLTAYFLGRIQLALIGRILPCRELQMGWTGVQESSSRSPPAI